MFLVEMLSNVHFCEVLLPVTRCAYFLILGFEDPNPWSLTIILEGITKWESLSRLFDDGKDMALFPFGRENIIHGLAQKASSVDARPSTLYAFLMQSTRFFFRGKGGGGKEILQWIEMQICGKFVPRFLKDE